jgi:hypothetical protein
VFRTIEQESGPGGPQWLSDHPNPGNRYEYITKEAQLLHVANAERDSAQFQQVQAHLRTLSPAPSSEEVARNRNAGRDGGSVPDRRPSTGNIEPPSTQRNTYTEGNFFRVAVPSNWREISGNNAVTFAPEGAYGTISGNSVFTHGIEMGLARTDARDLKTATSQLLQSLQQSNPRLTAQSNAERGSIGGRQALHTVASNVSDATGGQEVIDVYTTQLKDGSLFYVLGVSPREDFNRYSTVFRDIVRSIQFTR